MRSQNGSSLIVVIVILALLMVVSGTFLRSADVANQVSGNIAFKETATQGAGFGVTAAETQLTNQVGFEADIANNYFATQQVTDVNGLPTTVNWALVASTPMQNNANYNVQYVIERLCVPPLPVATFTTQCSLFQPPEVSNKLGDAVYTANSQVLYRITVRITGPKNTLTYVQAILAR